MVVYLELSYLDKISFSLLIDVQPYVLRNNYLACHLKPTAYVCLTTSSSYWALSSHQYSVVWHDDKHWALVANTVSCARNVLWMKVLSYTEWDVEFDFFIHRSGVLSIHRKRLVMVRSVGNHKIWDIEMYRMNKRVPICCFRQWSEANMISLCIILSSVWSPE